jgi:hypothetical protein
MLLLRMLLFLKENLDAVRKALMIGVMVLNVHLLLLIQPNLNLGIPTMIRQYLQEITVPVMMRTVNLTLNTLTVIGVVAHI